MMKSLASAEVLSETRERLFRLTCDDKALWGSMSAAQMARHLAEACDVALGERIVPSVPGPPPLVLKWVALHSGLRWAKNLQSTPELARAIEEPCSEDFSGLVKAAVKKMELVATGQQVGVIHPFFGKMTPRDWMRWGYLHADHHLRQFGR